jgi:hypothetical protein
MQELEMTQHTITQADTEIARLRILAGSTLDQVRVNPQDLKAALAVIDEQNQRLSEFNTAKYEPNTDSHPVLAHTLFMNTDANVARAMAEELGLLNENDNPDLSDMQRAQLWWTRASHAMKGNDLIEMVTQAHGYPTSRVEQKAP